MTLLRAQKISILDEA
jgi:hypothetical protein